MNSFSLTAKKKKIEGFASAAQRVPQNRRWIFSDAFLYESEGSNTSPNSISSIFLNRFFAITLVSKTALLIALLPVALSVILLKWRFDWRFRPNKKDAGTIANRLFVGFGAAAEQPLLNWYRSQSPEPVTYIDSAKSLVNWHKVPFLRFFNNTLSNFIDGQNALSCLPLELESLRLGLHVSLIKHVGLYSYWDTWFADLRKHGAKPEEILCIHSGLSTFAAVDNGYIVNFHAHGLIRHSIVFPDFTEMELMTEFELEHVKIRNPNFAKASLQGFRITPTVSPNKNKIVLFVAAFGSSEETDSFKRFTKTFPLTGYKFFLRPRINNEVTNYSPGDFLDNIEVLTSEGQLLDVLSTLNPKLVVSTASAGLVEADQIGCTPISLASESDRVIIDMVFPMLEAYLNWPRDEKAIFKLLEDALI